MQDFLSVIESSVTVIQTLHSMNEKRRNEVIDLMERIGKLDATTMIDVLELYKNMPTSGLHRMLQIGEIANILEMNTEQTMQRILDKESGNLNCPFVEARKAVENLNDPDLNLYKEELKKRLPPFQLLKDY